MLGNKFNANNNKETTYSKPGTQNLVLRSQINKDCLWKNTDVLIFNLFLFDPLITEKDLLVNFRKASVWKVLPNTVFCKWLYGNEKLRGEPN